MDFGLALYRGGGIGAAVTQWQQALAEDPVQQHGLTFLIARGNYDLGRYQASIDVMKYVLRASADSTDKGQCLFPGRRLLYEARPGLDARTSYNLSLKEHMLRISGE